MPDLPTGTVTFLFTDVEGSSRLWEQQPDAMRQALARHDAIIEQAIAEYGGVVVRPRGEGDSRFAVFGQASSAVAVAAAIQAALYAEPWPTPSPLRVRLALHTGEADLRDADYYGPAVNRCARLRALAHGGQALLSQATYDLSRDGLPEGVRLQDLGEHRLADLNRAEHVFQVLPAGLPADFPPLRSLEALPNNLPLQLTSFIGREREMAEVQEALQHTRLLTLTGTGGCGKTRVALQAAAELLERFPDGVWLAELASLTDPALLPATVAGVLGVREQPGQRLQQTVVEALRSKRLLLVLDNCEHLLGACAQLADALLRGCRGLAILATSREALGIAGETSRRVPSLALPPGDGTVSVEQVANCAAVRLFRERALAAQPRFDVTEQNVMAVAQLCRRLDGIPLGLELAAARLKTLGVRQLAERLDERFRLLTGGSRTALPRQQTLRAAIDWSYDLLTEPERRLFQRLSVFADSCTLDAAEAVCSEEGIARDDVLDLLARLVDQSLVLAEEEADGGVRYRLLETLRQYGHERLSLGGEAVAIRDRHAAFYLRFAETTGQELPANTRRERLAALHAERGNLRAALAWLTDGQRADQAARLATALAGYWLRRRWTEGHRAVEAILALPNLAKSTRVALLDVAEGLALWRGDLVTRRRYHEEGLALARDLGDRRLIARFLARLGASHHVQGDLVTARRLCLEGLAIFRQLNDEAGVARTLFTLADVTRDEGDFVAARELYEEVLAYARGAGDEMLTAWPLTWLGVIALVEGDMLHAEELLEEALGVWRAQDVPNFTVYLGLLCRELLQGDGARVRQWAQEYGERWPHGELAPTPARIFARGLQEFGLGQAARALRLLASSQRAWQRTPNANLPVRLLLDQVLPVARDAVLAELGSEAAARCEAEGRAMTLDQARDFALGDEAADAALAASRRLTLDQAAAGALLRPKASG